MKKLLFLNLLVLACFPTAYAQYCGGLIPDENPPPALPGFDCSKSGSDYVNYYRYLDNYIPNAQTAKKTVHINFVIWQNDQGTTNFQDNPTDRGRLYDYIHHPTLGLNFQCYDRYISPSDPVPGVVEVQTKQVRFQLEHIYFMQNTALADAPVNLSSDGVLQTALLQEHPEAVHQVNVHIVTGTPPGYWGFASYSHGIPVIVTSDDNYNLGYPCNPSTQTTSSMGCPVSQDPGRDWSFMMHIAHELGHTLELNHTYVDPGINCYGGEYCTTNNIDYMNDLFPYSHGEAWCDLSTNPCNLNCDVCFQRPGGDPYASSSDAYTNNVMSSNDFHHYLSPKQLGKVHRSFALKAVSRASSGYSSTPKIIYTDETWDFGMQLYQDLHIYNGATLTLTCLLKMPKGGKILIYPGAKLILNGGTITKSNPNAGDDWEGISVIGDAFSSQTPANQGVLQIIDGTISYARTAVQNIGPGTGEEWFYWGSQGGIIEAEGAMFYNNNKDVQLLAYADPTAPNVAYKASFRNCSFNRDDAFSSNNLLPSVTLWQVRGVSFEGCSFNNTHSGQFKYAGGAIRTIDAGYKVGEYGNEGCLFSGYADAIRSTNSSYNQAAWPISIVGADFDNNIHSIYLMETQFAKVAYNTISVKSNYTYAAQPPYFQPKAYGIYMDYSNLFQLHDNTLNNPDGTNYLSAGIVINHNRGTSDQLYKNTLNNFYWGIQAIGNNQSSLNPDFGLKFKCNDLGGTDVNSNDILVNEDNPAIAQTQGTLEDFPNNLFSYPIGRHFDNFGPNALYTFGSGNNRVEPHAYLGLNVASSPYDANYLEHCLPLTKPARINSPGTTLAEIYALDGELEADIVLRNQLINNGNTPELEAQVFFAQSQTDYQDLYLDLMDIAPYVSEEILYDVTQLEHFPELALRNIMVANPDGVRDGDLLDVLEELDPPLSQQTLDDIEDEIQTITAKDVLDMKIALNQETSERLSLDLLEYYSTQITEGNTYEAIKQHLKYRDEAAFRYALVDMYLAEGDVSNAENELDLLPHECTLSTLEHLTHDYMLEFYEVVLEVCENPELRMDQLEEAHIQVLLDLLQDANAIAIKGKVVSLLELNEVPTAYVEPLAQASSKTQRTHHNSANRPAVPQPVFKLYPNPAEHYTLLQWNWFEAGLTKGFEVNLYDLQGTLVKRLEIVDVQTNNKLIATKGLAPGVYLVQVTGEDQPLFTEKLSIQ